ncbi:hypothetical protein CQU01_24810 [Cerasibacillus quisquiliarum]|uniref:Uncharacterized protein n=1 Tax=Cerasibacillus quisquiliarum TaxID=227865 RepID=A0A511V3C9_9BACI|nr:hypothetical protein CQU01_24810 [Cerasibacillus quisquiliarum]
MVYNATGIKKRRMRKTKDIPGIFLSNDTVSVNITTIPIKIAK